MPARVIDLENDLIIEQGATWRVLELYLPGDYSVWSARGHLRKNYGGVLYAQFNFDPIEFGDYTVTINKVQKELPAHTRIVPFLTPAQTDAIPATSFKSDDIVLGVNAWVYDIELTMDNLDSYVRRIAQGYARVSPQSSIPISP